MVPFSPARALERRNENSIPERPNEQVNEVMERRNCTRKAALRWLNRNREDRPKGKAAAAPAKLDGKQAAANDKPEPTPATTLTPEQRGAARSEDLRLYKLAGKPKKSDFIKVFGKKGVAWTWEARAKALGIPSAEECPFDLAKVGIDLGYIGVAVVTAGYIETL